MADVFMTEDFLLESDAARELYQRFAQDQPILDYHCHLPPQQVAEDYRFENMTDIWLAGDHYKWRLMRACGVPERYCTGDASDWEKFLKWAGTVPKILRNPLYHWTHMELKTPFGIRDRLFNTQTAEGIWQECNAKLAEPAFSARGIMQRMNVVLVCTTDDPADSLEHHAAVAADEGFGVQMLPTFRPDKAMAVESTETFNAYVDRLAEAADLHIADYKVFLDAIRSRHDFFHAMGCRLSDHGIEHVYADDYTDSGVATSFAKIRGGQELGPDEVARFKSAMLFEFAVLDAEKGWTQQFHMNVFRNNCSRLHRQLGPDVGCDSMGDCTLGRPLVKLFDRLDRDGSLAKTIVYSLNPGDNALLATAIGNFQDGSVPGKMQLGSGWWFNDQLYGMTEQMEVLSNVGVLSTFVGMLTDSRSFLSYTRHDYFRRLLCNILGTDIERGLLPRDLGLVGGVVADICYGNAARFFGFEGLPEAK
ncbi:MAG: glucuronate isomerase [Candidatus Brocadiae bacterium]|nr:glucuronate isomerase [Candidatus Brocadiia bacterium]